MKKLPSKNLITALVIVAILALGITSYFADAKGWLGFMRINKSQQKIEKPKKTTKKEETIPWWCVREEEYERLQNEYYGNSPGSGSSSEPNSQTPKFFTDPSLDREGQTPFNGFENPEQYTSPQNPPMEELTSPDAIPEENQTIVPTIEDSRTNPDPDANPEGSPEIYETIFLDPACDCDETEIYIEEVDKTYRCPNEYGSSVSYNPVIVDNIKYYIYVRTLLEIDCNPEEWACPPGYRLNDFILWEKCRTFNLVYGEMCNDSEIDSNVIEACEAVYNPYMEDGIEYNEEIIGRIGCIGEDECNDYFEMINNGELTSLTDNQLYHGIIDICDAQGYNNPALDVTNK